MITKFILFFLLTSGAMAQSLTITDIKNQIADNNIQTMESFIAHLPHEMKTNFTLMHDSKSLHASDFMRPRALLFDKKANYVEL
jgi:hypothetical protein